MTMRLATYSAGGTPAVGLVLEDGSVLDGAAAVRAAGGDPAREIVKYATRHGIDLIVLGGHGRSGVSRALLGSVAERVARTAPCPVLTVPPPEQLRPAEVEAEEAEPTPSSCIVCAGPSLDLVCAGPRLHRHDG